MKDPSIRRSLTLFRAFMGEQTDPDRCYSLLAQDAADQLERQMPLNGRMVVDVGGGRGHFTEEFRRRGAQSYLFEPDLRELGARGTVPAGSVVADGYLLPWPTASPTSASPPTSWNTSPTRRPSSAS